MINVKADLPLLITFKNFLVTKKFSANMVKLFHLEPPIKLPHSRSNNCNYYVSKQPSLNVFFQKINWEKIIMKKIENEVLLCVKVSVI